MSNISDRSPTAQACLSACLAAPAAAGQGVNTLPSRNAHQWRAIAYFLSGIEVLARSDAAAGKRSAADAAKRAGLQALPDGNHGDNRRSIK